MRRLFLLMLSISYLILLSPELLMAGDEVTKKIPLPTGLSKDTQFIIYYIDKRFEQVDKRFEILQREIDKRFEQVDKRFEIFQREIDKRFEQIDKRFEQVDKRFEQIDKRFEEVNHRFEQMMDFLWMMTGIFTTLTAVVIGFAFWDRRTIIRQARNEAIDRIEKEGRLQDFIRVLRNFAKKNQELAEIMKSFNLL